MVLLVAFLYGSYLLVLHLIKMLNDFILFIITILAEVGQDDTESLISLPCS